MDRAGEEPKVLLDSDVIRNFISGKKIDVLARIFPNRLCIVDIVKKELIRSKKLETIVAEFIKKNRIEEIPFPENDYDILFEYAKLVSDKLGEGESACLAIARYKKKYIASSNLKDVKQYCKTYGIKNYPTFDILHIARTNRIMTEKEINNFIEEAIRDGRKLPYRTYMEYLKKEKQMI